MEVLEAISLITDPSLNVKVAQAMRLLKRALALYPPSSIAFSFNGGKDSTVLLHLLRAAIAQLQLDTKAEQDDRQKAKGSKPFEGQKQSKELQQANGCHEPKPLTDEVQAALQQTTQRMIRPSSDAQAQKRPGAQPSGMNGLLGIRSFYFEQANDFEEVKAFVHDADSRWVPRHVSDDLWKHHSPYASTPTLVQDERYDLSVEYLSDPDFRLGLVAYLERTGVSAVMLGTRKGDPNAGDQERFCPSSDGWPPFMRVNPILDWTYHDVWALLRATNVPHCKLYDQGYTSLGSTTDTRPNSALRREDGTFSPAYALLDSKLERAGRSVAQTHRSLDKPRAAPPCTAGIVMVGDELLSGRVEDANTPFLCQQLHEMGWQVLKVVTVPDDVEMIGEELRRLSEAVEVVITSGGVGPTLDDVTMAGVAHALGEPLIRHPEYQKRLERHFAPAPLTPAHLKMAETPGGEATKLLDYPEEDGVMSDFPLVCCRNIYVLPGVPHLLRQKWRVVRTVLEEQEPLAHAFHNAVLRLSISDETRVAAALEEVSASSQVTLGSYPTTDQADGTLLLITLDAKELPDLEAALKAFRHRLPADCIIAEQRNVAQLSPRPSLS